MHMQPEPELTGGRKAQGHKEKWNCTLQNNKLVYASVCPASHVVQLCMQVLLNIKCTVYTAEDGQKTAGQAKAKEGQRQKKCDSKGNGKEMRQGWEGAPRRARADMAACTEGRPKRCSQAGAPFHRWARWPVRQADASSHATTSRPVASFNLLRPCTDEPLDPDES